MNSYALAAQVLDRVFRQGRSLTEALSLNEAAFPESNDSRIRYLCFQGCRWYHRYLAVLDRLLDKPLKEKDSDVIALLVMGLSELDDPEKADHAVINETVEACKQLKKGWAAGLTNGVLRNWQRSQADWQQELGEDSRYTTSHPGWLTKRFTKAWPDQFERIVNANNQQAPMSLRINLSQQSREQYLALLSDQGIKAQPSSISPSGIILAHPLPVDQIPGFSSGRVSVQDEAAQLAAHLQELSPEQHVLDACCAPGGKTGHILENGATDLQAIDLDPNRLQRVKQNLDRLHVNCDLRAADVSDPDSWWDGRLFDRILLDVPCSATGVIRRHPDIKILRRSSDIAALVTVQRNLLQTLWPLLKPGGLLLYATCSILPDENSDNIQWFLEQQTNAEAVPLGLGLSGNDIQLFPTPGSHDGFFYAKLRKVSEQA